MSQSDKNESSALNPETLRSILNSSASLLSQNRPGEAVEKLTPIYEQVPEDPDVAINLGGAYILQRRWDKAVSVLEPAAKAHPDNAMVWTNLAAAYLGRLETSGPEQQDQAIEAYEKALMADPKAPNVHYHLGLIYADRKELTRASAFFQRALEVNAADRDAQRWLDRVTRAMAEEQQDRKKKIETDPADSTDESESETSSE